MAPIVTKFLTVAELPHYYNNKNLSNVILHFGTKTIFAHKKLLAARVRGSRVFRNEFKDNSPFLEADEYTIAGHDEEIAQAMIRHIYGFRFDNPLVHRKLDIDSRVDWDLSVYTIALEYRVLSLSILAVDNIVEMLRPRFWGGDYTSPEACLKAAEQVFKKVFTFCEENALPDKLTLHIKPYGLFHRLARIMVRIRPCWFAKLCGSDARYAPFVKRVAWWYLRLGYGGTDSCRHCCEYWESDWGDYFGCCDAYFDLRNRLWHDYDRDELLVQDY